MQVDPARVAKGMYWQRAWSILEGCTPCAPECLNCWSAAQTHMRAQQKWAAMRRRYGWLTNDAGKFNGTVRFMEGDLEKPLRVKKPTVWAVWNDLGHEGVTDEQRNEAFGVMAICREHTFLILTKRPARMAAYLHTPGRSFIIEQGGWTRLNRPIELAAWPLPNVFLGTTCGHPNSLWRIRELLTCPAAKRFLSVEPLLSELDLTRVATRLGNQPAVVVGTVLGTDGRTFSPCGASGRGIDWLIIGCESGRNRRPCKLEWVESLVGQADAAGVPVFVKQLDINGRVSKDSAEWPARARRREFPVTEPTAEAVEEKG